ncbi:hypothetical protein [Natrialba sp. PRR66]|uniref:hypothetical protein n=1 Tax=Natrialba sp. PRR66 TaxID=3098146 RepID=UPI002B1E776A|nr:hypothetical protein [Natrialba sp. PRR66]
MTTTADCEFTIGVTDTEHHPNVFRWFDAVATERESATVGKPGSTGTELQTYNRK